MQTIGRVAEIWRYPVKSMGGERLEEAVVANGGIVGDRGWATRDEEAGEIRGAKKLPGLLQCSARYVEEPALDHVPPAEITFPDGKHLRADTKEAEERLSSLLGRTVTLWPIQPSSSRDHYRRALNPAGDIEAELRDVFGRLPEEPLPDLSVFPPEIFELTSPAGTYFDAFSLHLLTTTSLDRLAERNPGSRADVRRFRPNLLIEVSEPDASSLPENTWCGREIRIGETRIAVAVLCPRCVMPTLPQGDLPKDPGVLRTIVREMGQSLGVYAAAEEGGRIRVGDPVALSA